MPWNVNVTNPFDADVWELYNLNEDFSESNNLAKDRPSKLEIKCEIINMGIFV